MRVLISGATGLLGQSFLRVLRESGDYEVRCLVRRTSRVERLGGLDLVYGDAEDANSVEEALRGMDAFVHVAGIQYAPQVLEAMKRSGVDRLVVISSTSAHSRFEFRSGPRLTNEKLVRECGLEWTIVRPSMIYGSEMDHNMHHLLRFLDRWPVYPMFGSGKNLWQPVYHEDLAHGVFEAFVRERAVGEIYDLPGGQPLPYIDLVRAAARALGRKVRVVHVPAEPVRLALKAAEVARIPLPVKSEQVLRLREDKAFSYEKARRELGYAPRSFESGIAREVDRLREIGMVK